MCKRGCFLPQHPSFSHTWGLYSLSKLFFFGLNNSFCSLSPHRFYFLDLWSYLVLYPRLFSEGPIPSWNTFAKTETPMPAGAFPFLGRADFTGLTNCSSFYVIPHGLCLFCNGGKYFTTWQKLKHWCSASWHAVLFRSTKHPLAHLPVFVSLTILALDLIWLTPSVPQAAPVSVQATGVSVQQTPNSYQVS